MTTRVATIGLLSFLLLLTPALARAQQPAAPQPAEPAKKDDWQSPAKAADPPLLPPPSGAPSGPPTSTSGTDVAPVEPSPATSGPAITLVDHEAEARQDARLRQLEMRVTRDEHHIHRLEDKLRILKNLTLSGFIQPQFLATSYNTAASPNLQANGALPPGVGANDAIAKADGTSTNGTFFRVRRARMRTTYETESMRMFLQIDAFPVGGIGPGVGTILRNAEATGIARWGHHARTEFTAGLFFTPFRFELMEVSLYRPFIERTWFIQNAFPVERDYGVHMKTIAMDNDRLVVDLSIVNGQRLGEKYFTTLPDLNHSKDFIGYLTYDVGPVTLGASGYVGRGQLIDPNLLRFKQYSKWAVNYQARLKHHFFEGRLGRILSESRVYSELTIAQNMDVGTNYAFGVPRIPTAIGDSVANLDQRALYIRLEQDLGRRWTLGYRYDMYTPNTAIKNNARDTHAFLLVWKLNQNLRLMNELDWAIDNVHALPNGPSSKHIVQYSGVLQAMF